MNEAPSAPPPRAPPRPAGRKAAPIIKPTPVVVSVPETRPIDTAPHRDPPPSFSPYQADPALETDVYHSWSPVYREKKGGSNISSSSVRYSEVIRLQSGLKHQVLEREKESELQGSTTLPKGRREQTAKEEALDRKMIARVSNSSLHDGFARCGEFTCIIVLIGIIVLIVFLGVFFTFFFAK